MVIGFKTQFVKPILQGTKVHTIRDDKGNRWKPGMIMHMYTGGRFSKEYRQFAEKSCVSTQHLKITAVKASDLLGNDDEGYFLRIQVDGLELNKFDLHKLSVCDGFDSLGDFNLWWLPIALKEADNTFRGKIIHWTDLRY